MNIIKNKSGEEERVAIRSKETQNNTSLQSKISSLKDKRKLKCSVDSMKQTVALILSSLSESLKFEFPNKIILITYVSFFHMFLHSIAGQRTIGVKAHVVIKCIDKIFVLEERLGTMS